MNKKVTVVAGLLVVVGALAFAGITYAQTPTPPGTPGFGMTPAPARLLEVQSGAGVGGYGRGLGLGAGMAGGMMNYYRDGGFGPMHDAMRDAIAEGLGLTREELDSRIASGETPYEIAQAQGLTQQEFAQLMVEARQTAIEQAVADGLLTQEQADWMLSHMGGRGGRLGPGAGGCPMFNQGTGADA